MRNFDYDDHDEGIDAAPHYDDYRGATRSRQGACRRCGLDFDDDNPPSDEVPGLCCYCAWGYDDASPDEGTTE